VKRKPVLFGILFILIILSVLVYSTLGLAKYKVEICVQYNGRTSCRSASGSSREDTYRAAMNNACALIASGVTETMQCESSQPVSIRWVREP